MNALISSNETTQCGCEERSRATHFKRSQEDEETSNDLIDEDRSVIRVTSDLLTPFKHSRQLIVMSLQVKPPLINSSHLLEVNRV